MSVLFSRLQWFWRRALARLRRDRLDDEFAEEIDLHLELRRQALVEAGVDPREAGAAARRQFGNVTFIREESRAMWGFRWLDTIEQDTRYGIRLLRRTPWFTAVAVLSLATGIGSAATVFNLVDAVLLRLLPVRAPEELRVFAATISLGAGAKHVGGMDRATLAEVQRAADFGDLIGFQVVDDIAVAQDPATAPRSIRAEGVTDNYFGVLGVTATAGRLLTAGDTGSTPMPVVLSEQLWKTAYGGDRSIVTRTITVSGIPAAVVGVARGFRGVVADRPADVFLPLDAAPLLDARMSAAPVQVITRLRPGVTPLVAEQKMAALYLGAGPSMVRAGELRVALSDARHGVAEARAPLARPLLIGLVLAGVLLLVSCANTGGLLLARFAARQGEFGLRVAIGASRSRLLRQLTVEALLLAVIAAAAGLTFAKVAAPLLIAMMPAGATPPAFELRFDWRLVLFTAVLSAAAALVAGGMTLIRVTRAEPARILNLNARTVVAGRRGLTRLLIGAQIASSLLLVVGAAAMTRTLVNLRSVDPGFDAGDAFAVRVETTGGSSDRAALAIYFEQLRERIASAPQVRNATFAQVGLMTGSATTGTVEIAGFVPGADSDRWTRMFWVGPDFFETTGMRVMLGRDLEPYDSARGERVAVVNERFARFYFRSAEAAIGQRVNRDVRIVGVVADARYDTLRDEPARAMFIPYAQAPPRSAMTFVVRPAGDRARAVDAATAAVRAHDPRIRSKVTSLSDQIAATMLREHFMAVLATVLSCLAVFLSCAGLYAAVSYAVSERRGELAVRLALGASGRDIIRLILREPLRTALAGIAIGIPGAYAVMQAASSLLYGIAPFDVGIVAIAALSLVAAATVAALWPALRARRIDPLAELRAH